MKIISKCGARAFFVFILCASLLLLGSCSKAEGKSGEYTYTAGVSSLGTNWNPHTWQTNGDNMILEYLSTPFVSVIPLDTNEGTYQWSFEGAVSVEDVTKEHLDDLIKYKVALPDGVKIDNLDTGYVFEIRLREGLRFEDGKEIRADDYIYSMKELLDPKMKNYRANQYYSGEAALAGAYDYYNGEGNVDFDTVGLYRADDYTLRYVTADEIEYNYFMTALSSSWLVHKDTYESGKSERGGLTVSDYGTSLENTRSFGPYRLLSFEDDKQAVFVRNEKWYGYKEDEEGHLYSECSYRVDGEIIKQYEATRVVLDVVSDDVARQRFFKGELIEYSPTADEAERYMLSERLYRSLDTYTMSLFFNTDGDVLADLDRTGVNKNSVVLSNANFREAMSLSLNRDDFVTVTDGWQPSVGLLSDAYRYDVYNDPDSSYRRSEAAMREICDMYGIRYGEGERYESLESAYRAVTGYDRGEAKTLFEKAYRELAEAELYRSGEDIKIQIAWSKGALTSDDNAAVLKISEHINAAAAGSGFGKIILEPIGNIENRYSDVPTGKYAIGFGAWGGAAFYPFRNFRVYMDPEYASLHEGGCWDPSEEKLTLDVFGERVTMSYKDWSRSMIGSGRYSRASSDEKLELTAKLERSFLSLYYRIPLATTVSSSLLSYKVENLTEKYSIMYGYGGFRFLSFNYDDREWGEYLEEAGYRLGYV